MNDMEPMSDAERAEMAAAYRSTAYMVDAPGAPIALRVDQPSPELDELLERFGQRDWVFITGYNPRSEQVDPEENKRRHSALRERIDGMGLTAFEARGVDDEGEWPSEKGLVVLGLDRDAGTGLGRELEENAILVGRRGGVPALVFCR